MTQPSQYEPAYDFTAYTPAELTELGTRLAAELAALSTFSTQVRASLAAIQRDDTLLKNLSVHPEALSSATRALIGGGWEVRGAWLTATAYAVSDVVAQSTTPYVCIVAHTSGTFATDLAAGKWVALTPSTFPTTTAFTDTLLDDANATDFLTTLGGTATGRALFTAASTTAALNTLGGTTVGKAVFIAASESAARTAIGLGTIATQNAASVTVTALTATTGAITNGTITNGTIANAVLTTAAITTGNIGTANVSGVVTAASALIGGGAGSSGVGAVAHLRAAGVTLLSARDETNNVESYFGAQSAGGRVGTLTNHALLLGTNNTDRWQVAAAGSLLPVTDNVFTIGSGVLRATELFAVAGTINTSDATEKTELRDLTAAELRAAKRISQGIGVYRWLDAVASKGNDARLHIGITAQDVAAALTAENLVPARYAFWCADALPGGGTRYGVRYDQLGMFLAAAFEQRLAALEA